jgi:hypothetical protein
VVPAVHLDRASFDEAFRRLTNRVHSRLGPPALDWRDDDAAKYQASVWIGTHGLLIAQQASIDTEFGDEICLAVEGVGMGELCRSTPFAAALYERHERLHDAYGFPRLPR